MSIAAIEQALKDRLLEDIDGIDQLVKLVTKPDGTKVEVPVQVKSYPRKPSEQTLKTLSSAGAVLVRYAGSKYGKSRKGSGWIVQDREMIFEVLCISDSLLAEDAHVGIYALLDNCGDRLIDYQPTGSVAGIELVQDDYLSERSGSWEYGILVSVKTQKVKNGNWTNMVTEKIFTSLAVAAGETSAGTMVALANLGASGDFALQISSDGPVTISYKASADNSNTATPQTVDGGGVICDHPGGVKVYWPDIVPAAKIWIYATAPAGGAGVTLSATLNVW
jgi:hypothetical protein